VAKVADVERRSCGGVYSEREEWVGEALAGVILVVDIFLSPELCINLLSLYCPLLTDYETYFAWPALEPELDEG
jgi:hypothetical protein